MTCFFKKEASTKSISNMIELTWLELQHKLFHSFLDLLLSGSPKENVFSLDSSFATSVMS